MSDNSNITRDDLVAIAYVLYSSLYEKDEKRLTPQDFALNCENAFRELSDK